MKNPIIRNDPVEKPVAISLRMPISFEILFLPLIFFGAIFMTPDLSAKENQGISNAGQVPLDFSNKNQPELNLPLSTWIGSGDMVRIRAFPDSTMFISGDYPILENGYAMLPLIGLVEVTGLSINDLTVTLNKSYAKFLAYPTLQIEPIIRISFLGGFLKPGIHKVNPMYSFSDALSTAEGTVRDDGLRLLRWERNGKVIDRDLTSEVEGSKSLMSLGFKSGDQVCITILTQRDRLQVISLILSTLLATGTLLITLVVINR